VCRFDTINSSGNVLARHYGMDPTDISGLRGGLAFDSRDDTIYIGTFNAEYHYTTAGVDLGHSILRRPVCGWARIFGCRQPGTRAV